MWAIEPNTSQDISVSLLKSILTEKEVKINDLSKELKRVETENLQLLEEKDLLLSEIETLRREFEVMTFDKERKKEDVLNLFDPNSPAVLQQQIVSFKNQISDLQEANESVVLELAKADEEISQQKKDMAKLKDEYNQKLEDSQEEIKLLTEKLSHMPSRFIERKNYEEDLHKEISHLRGECRRLRIHSHQLSEQNHHLQEELRDVKRQYECLIKSKTCSSTAEDEVEKDRLKNESFTKCFYSSNWNPEEDSLYRNDAFKVDGNFSKCKTAVGSLNIKGSWERNHEERFKSSPSPLSMASENTDVLITAFNEDSPEKPSQSVNTCSFLEELGSDNIYASPSKDSDLWNSLHQSPKSGPVRAFSSTAIRNPRPYLSILPRRPFAPKSIADLRVGHLVKFSRPGGKISKGTIQYKGHLCGREDVYLGVELEGSEVGKHDGIFQGARYFLCKPNKGVFVSFNKIIMAWE